MTSYIVLNTSGENKSHKPVPPISTAKRGNSTLLTGPTTAVVIVVLQAEAVAFLALVLGRMPFLTSEPAP
jgi:hypothetical protein